MSLNQVLIIGGADAFVSLGRRVPGAAQHALNSDDPRLAGRLPEVAALGGQLVVCGGTPTGIEAAAQFAGSYPALRVSLVTRNIFGAHLRETFKRLGIEILDQLEIVRVSKNALHFDGGRPMRFDIAVWAVNLP